MKIFRFPYEQKLIVYLTIKKSGRKCELMFWWKKKKKNTATTIKQQTFLKQCFRQIRNSKK